MTSIDEWRITGVTRTVHCYIGPTRFADVFHDVDLAVLGPRFVRSHRPESRPQALSSTKLHARRHAAVGKLHFAHCSNPSGDKIEGLSFRRKEARTVAWLYNENAVYAIFCLRGIFRVNGFGRINIGLLLIIVDWSCDLHIPPGTIQAVGCEIIKKDNLGC